ncbi:HNH endonuclease signature motif containing protein [Tepidanaerobacter syntrophicus]|uniref:HNH endonuclease signature motif containing protein n=1 Tax=Tepidanaerobacter syntrophicus TaxID=224999 RepID=UPI001BD637B5|nr:HNH endonuclease signature motif containing protein [Tepidanaerobacter syntrophicus]
MTKIVIDPGHGNFWEEKVCLECGKQFLVRKCYVKRGQGKFCSISCATTYRNRHNNPSKRPEVKVKISKNHADVSGPNNPMYGKTGEDAPGWIDGRNAINGDIWRKIALINKPPICEICGAEIKGRRLNVHHKDKDRSNNNIANLQIVCVECHNNILHPRKRNALGRFTREVV